MKEMALVTGAHNLTALSRLVYSKDSLLQDSVDLNYSESSHCLFWLQKYEYKLGCLEKA